MILITFSIFKVLTNFLQPTWLGKSLKHCLLST